MTTMFRGVSPRLRAASAALLVLGALPLAVDGGLNGEPAEAEVIEGFTPPIFSTNTNGAIDIIGNALQTCSPITSTNCVDTQNGTRNSGNGSFSMQFIDIDDGVLPSSISNQTSNSSMANFTAPAGSSVLYAGLYWSAQSSSSQRNRIDFLAPGDTSYTRLTGSIANNGILYQGFADVTSQVQAAGDGDYWVGDIAARTGTNRYAAWSMVVVYSNPGLPVRNLSVFDGFARVRNSDTIDVPVSGFLTPPFGDVTAEIGIVAYEGDRNITGDRVSVQNGAGSFVRLSNGANPETNFFNSSITDNGVFETASNPAYVNTMAADIDELETTNLLGNSQTSTTVRFQTSGDWYYPGVVTFAVDIFAPEFPTITKTVTDVNGGQAVPGDELEYAVTATNVGNDFADDVVISDVVPANTSFVPGSLIVDGAAQNDDPSQGVGGFDGTSVIGRVGAGAGPTQGGTLVPTTEVGQSTGTVTFRVLIAESARGTDIVNAATFDYTARTLGDMLSYTTNDVLTPVPPAVDLRVEKIATPSPVNAGDDVSWTVTVTNDGPSPATGVVLSDAIPAGLTPTSVSGPSCTTAAAVITCDVGSLAVGATSTLTFDTTIPAATPDDTVFTNSASATADEDDTDPTNDIANRPVVVGSAADLSLTKTDSVDPASPGDSFDYTLTVSNAGPSAAVDVVVADQPPVGVTVTGIASSDGAATCALASNTCTLPSLAPGASETLTVTVSVDPAASGTLTNGATVTSSTTDPALGNNAASEDTTIVPLADVSVVKTRTSAAPVIAGEPVTYELVVSNAGPSPAENVSVADTLDPVLSSTSASATVGTCAGDPVISCALGTLGAGASVTITVVADVADTATGTNLANTAAVTTTTQEPGGGGNPNSSTVNDTVANSADLRVTKTVDQNPLLEGDAFLYTITVFNDGPSASSGTIVVDDALPVPLLASTVSSGCTINGGGTAVTCASAASLPVGNSIQFTIAGTVPTGLGVPTLVNTATVTYPTDPNGTNNSADAESDLATDADIVIDKEWSATSVDAGDDATFTLDIRNDGPSAAVDIDVADALPAGLSVVSASGPGADCSASAGSNVDCTIATLGSGSSVTVTVVASVPPTAPSGQLNNSASATSASTPDRNPSNNTDVAAIDVTRLADLSITKVASNTAPLAGTSIDYTVTVTNAGPSSSTSTFVGDALPPGLTITSFPANCTAPGGVLTCDLGEIDPSTSIPITYTVFVDESVDPGPITNTAQATSTTPLVAPASVDEVVAVGTSADVVVTKTASVDPATPGGSLVYELTIDNAGPSDARNLVVTDAVPTGFNVTNVASTGGTCDSTVECTLPVLADGGSVTVTITGEVDSGYAASTMTNTVDAVTSDTPDPDTGNNTPSITIDVEPQAQLTITKSASPATIPAGGGNVTYSVAVSNAGPSDAQDVSVPDVLPAEFADAVATPSQGTCTGVDCDLGTVAAGEVGTVTIVGNFPATATSGTKTNTASVSSSTTLLPASVTSADADVDVTLSADVEIAKTGPVTVNAGDQVTYTLTAQNAGPSVATGVTITDVLDGALLDAGNATVVEPPGTTCTNTAGTISCSLPDLAIGQLVSVQVAVDVLPGATAGADALSNSASIASATPDPDGSNNNSTLATDVTVSADVSISKVDAGVPFIAGQPGSYTITVTNNGPSNATGVTVDDTPPSFMTFTAVVPSQGSCTSFPCDLGDVAAGSSATITVTAVVDETSAAIIANNTATVTTTSNDPNPSNNSSTESTSVQREADLEVVSKTGTPDPVIAGETIDYEIVVRNNGSSLARDVLLSDALPANTALIAGSLPIGCTDVAGTVECDLGDLAPGGTDTIDFSVVVDAGTPAGSTIDNTASISSPTTDPNSANDEATSSVTVSGEADLGIVKTAAPTPAVPGQTLTYTLTVTNGGPSDATDVVVADDVTGIFDGAVTVTPPPGITCDTTVSCGPFDFAAVDSPLVFTIEGTAAAANAAPIDNTATVSAATTDTGPGNDQSTISTPVAPSADLSIAKVDDIAGTVDPTGTITYTVTATNNGPSDAIDVVVTDTPPAELTITSITPTPNAGVACDPVPPSSQPVSCTFPAVPVGADAIVTVTGTVSDRAVGAIRNSASVTSSTPDPTPANDAVDLDTPVTPLADVSVVKSVVTPNVVAGLPLRYQLDVTNDGPASAENVQLVDTLPAGVTFVAVSSPIGTCSTDGPPVTTVTCDLGDIGDQAALTILLDVIVDAGTRANLANSATISTTTDQPAGGGDPDTSTTNSPVTVAPDLRVEKELVDPTLVAGDPYTYTITSTNDGPSVASGTFTLTDTLPTQIEPGADDVTLSNTTDCSYTPATRLVTCTYSDDLAVGASQVVTISGTIQATALTVDDNTATVATTDADPDLSNNSGTATADLATNADLVAAKTFADASVIAGEQTTFTMSVTNDGPSQAIAVDLDDALPTGMSFVSFANVTPGMTCSATGGGVQIDCDIPTLAAGASSSVDVTVQLSPDFGGGPVTNTATAASTTDDRNPSNNAGVDSIDVTREADISITKAADVTTVVAGDQITYTLDVRNDGPSSSEASVIGDVLPAGVDFVLPLPPGCTGTGGLLDCDLGTIQPMAPTDPAIEVVYSVVVDPAVDLGTALVNSATVSSITPPPGGTPPPPGSSTVDVATEADVEIVAKTAIPDPVVAGETASYTITARNNGPSIARNSEVVDALPSSLTPVPGSLPVGCSVTGGNDVTCALGTFAVAETRVITFDATVGTDVVAGSTITNDASISSDETDPDTSNDDGSVDVGVVALADLSITKASNPTTIVPGQAIDYTIVVTNPGPSNAQDVVVGDAVPAGITGVVAAATLGTCTVSPTNDVNCDVGDLAPGSITVTITGTVAPTVVAPIPNTATVATSTDQGPNTSPDSASTITPVAPVADLSIAKYLAPNPPVPGAPVQYTITVANPGPSASQNVVVTDSLDPALTNIASATTGCAVAGQDVTCSFPTLAPGTQTIVVTADLDEGFTGDLPNSAVVTTDTSQGPNTSPDIATVTATAAPGGDLALTKTASPDPVVAGESLVYTLTVTNDGPSTSRAVVVDDALPAGFTTDDITSSQGGCTAFPCSVGDLAVGASATVTVNGSVDSDVLDLSPNFASVTATTPDGNAANDTASADPQVTRSASVITTKTLTSGAPAIPGTRLEWTITVANNGPSDALDVSVDDTLPADVTNVSVTPSVGSCTTFPCSLGTITPGQTETIVVAADLPAGVLAGTISNSAATSSSTPDPDPSDNNPIATDPVTPTADVTIGKVGPAGDIVPGNSVDYTLTVANVGPSDAQSIAIADLLPLAFDPSTVSEVSPLADCTITGLAIDCTQATLEAGQSTTVTITASVLADFAGADITNTAGVLSATPDPDGSNNTASVTNPNAPEADLAITKTTTVAPVVPGQPVGYEIVVTNPGPSDSVNVVVTDAVDPAVTNLATPTPGCAFSGQDLACTFAAIAAGSSETITFTGDLASGFLGTLTNTASLTTETDQGADAAANSATTSDPVAASADLTVTKADDVSPGQAEPGGTLTYTIAVANSGPSDATDVVVTDLLPADVTASSVTTPSAGASCVLATATCTIPSVAAGTTATITIATVVSDRAVGQLSNTAFVTTDTPDPNPGGELATISTDVEPFADLGVTKSVVVPSPGPIVAGQPARYELVVTNDGPATAVGVAVTDVLPGGTSFVSASTPVGGCAEAPTGTITCSLGDLGDQASVTILINVEVDPAQSAALTNSASVVSPTTTDPVAGNDTATDGSAVRVAADLAITKTLVEGTLTAGDSFTYELDVVNNGPSTAVETITVTDTLPAQVDTTTVALSDTTNCSFTAATRLVACAYPADLIGGGALTLTITGQILSGATSVDDNTAIVGTVDDPSVDQVDPDGSNNSATASADLATNADLVVTKTFAAGAATAGTSTDFTLEVRNDGPSDATNVSLGDVLPAGLTVVSQAPTVTGPAGSGTPSCSVTAAAGIDTLTCTVTPLVAGATLSVAVTADVAADLAAGSVANSASVTSDTDDRNPSSNTATDSITIDRAAQFTIAKTADVATQNAGDDIVYEIVVTNTGPSSAEATVIGDALPLGVTLDVGSITVTPAVGTCAALGGILNCDLGELAPTTTVTIGYTVTIDPAVSPGTILTNNAQVSSATPQPDPSDPPPSSGTGVLVTGEADLEVGSKTADPTTVVAGQTTRFEIAVRNNGPSVSEDAVVTDDVPSGLTVDAGSLPATCSLNGAGDTISCALGDVLPGFAGEVTITYDATVDPDVANGSLLTNTATATSPTTTDPNAANSSDSASIAVDTEADLAIAKVAAASPFVPGAPISWTITIINGGPSDAQSVTVADSVPATVSGVTLTASQGGCVAFPCDLGTVPAGGTATIVVAGDLDPAVTAATMANTASVSSTTADPDASNDSATATTLVAPSADIRIAKAGPAGDLVPGQDVTWAITVTNDGPSDARSVQATDRLPTAIDLTSPITIDGGSAACSRAGRDVTCDQATLADGATITIEIAGTVLPGVTSTIENAALLTSATDDPDPSSNSATSSNDVAPIADIGIEKAISTSPIVPGATVDFVITVTNDGPSSAQNVVVTDTLSSEFSAVASATPGCSIAGNTMTCALPTVDPGTTTIALSGVLDPAVTGQISNTAVLTTDTPQTGVRPDSSTVIGDTAASADLAMSKTATPDPVVAGEDVTYVITATNLGPSDAVGVQVSDALPAGLTLVSVSSSQGGCTALPCDFGTVPASANATLTIVATLDPDATSLAANSASVIATTPDPNAANDTATAAPAVTTRADLTITKVLTTPTAVPGEPVRWVITVDNPGPSDAQAVSVDDVLPLALLDVGSIVVSSSQGGCTVFPCDLGTITAGADATITIDADVPPSVVANTIENAATVSASTPDGNALDNTVIASDPIAPAADLGIEKVGPAGPVIAGTSVSWTITVTNDGPSDSRDVLISDDLPAALDASTIVVTASDASCTLTGFALSCSQAVLADGATTTVTVSGVLRSDFTGSPLENVATVTSLSTTDLDPTNNTSTASNDNTPLADVSITASASPTSIAAGTTTGFAFTIVNGGPSDAAATEVRIPLPAAITVSGTPTLVGAPPGATVTVVGGEVIVTLGALPPGAPVTLSFGGTVSPDQPAGPLGVAGRVSTSTDQSDTTNDAATVTLDVTTDVVLTATKAADRTVLGLDDEISFTIEVRNGGASTATGVTIEDSVPSGLADPVVDASPVPCTVTGNVVTCDGIAIPPGDTVQVRITARAVGNGDYENVAEVRCACLPGPVVGTSPVGFEVVRVTDLAVTKIVDRGNVRLNESVVFGLTVTNRGPDPAVGVRVVDRLPSGFAYRFDGPSVGDYDPTTGVWTIGDLAVGQTQTLSIVARVVMIGTQTNTATVESATTDPAPADNTASASVAVLSGGLPATGASGSWHLMVWAFGLLVLGVGLWLLGPGSRRRPPGTLART